MMMMMMILPSVSCSQQNSLLHRKSHYHKVLSLIGMMGSTSTAAALSATTTTTSAAAAAVGTAVLSPSMATPYGLPSWCQGHLTNVPVHGRLHIANLPTPMYRICPYNKTRNNNDNNNNKNDDDDDDDDDDIFSSLAQVGSSLYIKRDDATGGVELGGNKIRKLEFLLADALAENYDAVVTIGGIQSNHCRATAGACRMVGLEPHLILRTRDPEQEVDKMIGNVLVDRMVGSRIYTCTPGEYGRVGSAAMVQRVCAHLKEKEGIKAYPIPVGGSNGLGSWGYIEGVSELLKQWKDQHGEESGVSLDHVVFACGSGGTAAGIVLGMALAHGALDASIIDSTAANRMPQLHAVGVCDDPDYFFATVADIANQMGLSLPKDDSSSKYKTTEEFIRAHLTVHQGKGLGYAQSTDEELGFVSKLARTTGIVLDPVYSGKALYRFWRDVIQQDNESFRNKTILFWHTGGALGLFDKCDELRSKTSMQHNSPCQRLDIYGKGTGLDISK